MKRKTKFNWPLCADVFTFWDKLKISWFLFSERIWTYGIWIRKYEQMWESTFRVKHAVMVSSGSTANELIALRRKYELQQAGEWPHKNKVVFPVNTWISSVSPWIHAGFEPVFMDVQKHNLNSDVNDILNIFNKDLKKEIGTVFYTSLLGFFNDILKCKEVTENNGAKFLMDNCESSFSYFHNTKKSNKYLIQYDSILSLTTCSTSIFYSHFTTSGTEGGLIFTDNEEEAEWYRMARSHGMTRGMPEKYKNKNVSPEFDFYLLGSNFRSSNLQAYMASLDFDRAYNFSFSNRAQLTNLFHNNLNKEKYFEFNSGRRYMFSCPLAIPILCHTKEQKEKIEKYLKDNGVMTRPIVGGCLLAHTAFKNYGHIDDFPVAKWAHECGIYIGLNQNITKDMIEDLTMELNNI